MKHSDDDTKFYVFKYLGTQITRFKTLVARRTKDDVPVTLDDTLVHDLRVTTRRIRAGLWVLRQDYAFEDLKPLKRLGRKIKALGRHLGERRELDVVLDISRHFRLDIDHIKDLHIQANRHLQSFMNANNQSIIADLDALMVGLIEDPPKKIAKTYYVHLMKQLYKWETNVPSQSVEYHELRIFIKKIRYIFEANGLRHLKTLKLIQAELGDLHDIDVLAEKVGRTPAMTLQQIDLKRKIHRHQPGALKFIARHL